MVHCEEYVHHQYDISLEKDDLVWKPAVEEEEEPENAAVPLPEPVPVVFP